MANTRKNRRGGDKSDETEKPVIDDENDNEVDKNVADAYEGEDTKKPSEQNDDESTSTSSSNPIESFFNFGGPSKSGVEEVDNFVELINKIDLSKLVKVMEKMKKENEEAGSNKTEMKDELEEKNKQLVEKNSEIEGLQKDVRRRIKRSWI